MAILNHSFEDPTVIAGVARPGIPDSWYGTHTGRSWEWAVFDSLIFIAEDFELGWLNNHLRRTIYGTGELDNAAFDVTIPETIEDFEEEWGSNEDWRSEFGSTHLDDAIFDVVVPEAVENFEEEWGSNEDFRLTFGIGELDDPVFDVGTPEAVEDFEEEWNDNEDRRTVFGGGELDDPVFATYAGTTDVETFSDSSLLDVPSTTIIGTPLSVDITQTNRVVFGGTLTGVLLLQFRRDGFATWETFETVSTVPSTVVVPSGATQLRIHRTVSGGTTTAAVLLPVLTSL